MRLLTIKEAKRIELKIEAAEKLTSAEFKIIICKHAWLGLHQKANKLFHKFQLDNTPERNTVLFLIVEKNKQLLIYGDKGIHEKTGSLHWKFIRDNVINEFKKDNYYNGISIGVHLITESLVEHFPADSNNKNEVSNAIIFE